MFAAIIFGIVRGAPRPEHQRSATAPRNATHAYAHVVDLNLNDKVAVVTGASKGIGFAVVQALAAEGATVVAGARSLDTLQGLERVTPIAVDLAQREGPARLIDAAVERHGQIDVLVNNVGAARVRTVRLSDPHR